MDFYFEKILYLYSVVRSSTKKLSVIFFFFYQASYNDNILQYSTKFNQ